jgi:hypothetical protein
MTFITAKNSQDHVFIINMDNISLVSIIRERIEFVQNNGERTIFIRNDEFHHEQNALQSNEFDLLVSKLSEIK